jgi:hypothetical protein
MMKEEGFGCCLSLLGDDLHFVGYSFVDDMDRIQSSEDGQSMEVLSHFMQAFMGTWGGGYGPQGGTGTRKSLWYLLLFKWDKGTWWYAKSKCAGTRAHTLVLNSKQEHIMLDRLEVHEAHKMLGVTTSPDGGSTA